MCCLCFESVNLDFSAIKEKPNIVLFCFFLLHYTFTSCIILFSFRFFFSPRSERVGQSNLLFLQMACFHFLLQAGNSLERLFSGPLAEQEEAASCAACQGNRSASWQRWGGRDGVPALGLAFISSTLCKAVLKLPDHC